MEDNQAPGVVASALVNKVERLAQRAKERDAERARRAIQNASLDFSEPRPSARSA